MTRHFLLQFFIAIGILSASGASAQPFGIAMGTAPHTLDINEEMSGFSPGWYELNSAPSPHSEFDRYLVIATPTRGVCTVQAFSVEYANDGRGAEVREAYSRIKKQIAEKYGPSSETSALKEGSPYFGDSRWVQSVLKGHRTLEAKWNDNSDSNLQGNIAEVILYVGAYNFQKSYLGLQYRFKTHWECETELGYPENTENSDKEVL